MPFPWAPMLANVGMSFLSGLFGGRKQKTSWEMSPEARTLLAQLKGELKRVPSYVTQPIKQGYGALRAGISERMGEGLGPGSGLETAQLARATAGESRASTEAEERHRMGLLNTIAGLVGGRGTQTTTTGAPWGDIFGGMGGDIGFLWGLQQMMGGGKKNGRYATALGYPIP